MTDISFHQTDTTTLNGKAILQLIPTLETGGAERTAVDMTRGIVSAGGRAYVASAGGRLVRAVEASGGVHITLPLDAKFRLDRHWRNRQALLALCRREKIDLIHARSRAPAFAALSCARALNVPFMTTYHGIYSENNALKRWYNSVMVAGSAVIANSAYTAELIRQRYPESQATLHIVHRGTDMALFDPLQVSQTEKTALRTRWRFPDNRPIVMLVARLTDWKGHLLAVKAAEILKRAGGVCPFFVFAGRAQSETYAARLRSAIFEAGLIEDVVLIGHADNVPLCLSLADLVIVPSTKPEAFGRSVAEASAMERPVIAFDHGGAVETIACPPAFGVEAQTGLRVAVGDVTALADAIKKIVNLPESERTAMGKRGRAHILRHFSTDQMIAKTLSVYKTLL